MKAEYGSGAETASSLDIPAPPLDRLHHLRMGDDPQIAPAHAVERRLGDLVRRAPVGLIDRVAEGPFMDVRTGVAGRR